MDMQVESSGFFWPSIGINRFLEAFEWYLCCSQNFITEKIVLKSLFWCYLRNLKWSILKCHDTPYISQCSFFPRQQSCLVSYEFSAVFPHVNVWFYSAKYYWLYSLSSMFRFFFLFIFNVANQLFIIGKVTVGLKRVNHLSMWRGHLNKSQLISNIY